MTATTLGNARKSLEGEGEAIGAWAAAIPAVVAILVVAADTADAEWAAGRE
jgi:hypothetical protein